MGDKWIREAKWLSQNHTADWVLKEVHLDANELDL